MVSRPGTLFLEGRRTFFSTLMTCSMYAYDYMSLLWGPPFLLLSTSRIEKFETFARDIRAGSFPRNVWNTRRNMPKCGVLKRRVERLSVDHIILYLYIYIT